MIDWWSILTTLIGAALIGIGGILWKKVNQVLGHVAAFAKHIDECEQRNENHRTIHRMQEHEVNRRLEMLERMR